MYYVTPLTPQIADSNMAKHIDYLSYAVWFDRARTYLYREMDPTLSFRPHGLVVVNAEVNYLKETSVEDVMEVRSWISKIGCKSFEVTQEVWRGDEVCVAGKVVMCGFDLDRRVGEPLTEQYRAVLEKYRWDGVNA